jgi:hypothetical protein
LADFEPVLIDNLKTAKALGAGSHSIGLRTDAGRQVGERVGQCGRDSWSPAHIVALAALG